MSKPKKQVTDFAAMKEADGLATAGASPVITAAEATVVAQAAANAEASQVNTAAQAEVVERDAGVATVNAPSDHSRNPGLVSISPEQMAEKAAESAPSRGELICMPHGDQRDSLLLAAGKDASHRRNDDDAELTKALTTAVAGVVKKRRKARRGGQGNSALKA